MEKLSEIVRRDYDQEMGVIKEAGSLWGVGTALAVGALVLWGIDLLSGRPWTSQDCYRAIIGVLGLPFIDREWERYKVSVRMRREREIRMEAKLDALLGMTNID